MFIVGIFQTAWRDSIRRAYSQTVNDHLERCLADGQDAQATWRGHPACQLFRSRNMEVATITSDVPSEAELTPALWGKWKIVPEG